MGKLFTNGLLSFIVSIITIQVIAFPIGILILFAALMLGFEPEPGLDIYPISLVATIIALPKAHQFLAWGRRNADEFGKIGIINARVMGIRFVRYRLQNSYTVGVKVGEYAYVIGLVRSIWLASRKPPMVKQIRLGRLILERAPLDIE